MLRTQREATVPEHKKKILTYRRADWLEDLTANVHFESFVRQALSKLTTVGQTSIKRDNGQILTCVAKLPKSHGGIFLHISAATPGEQASVISNRKLDEVETIDLGTIEAPDGNDFVDGDVFIFVRQNNVCVCSTGIHDGTIGYYFYRLFAKAQLNEKSGKFLLRNVADLEKIKFLHDHPIKSITLNAALFQASSTRAKDSQRARGVVSAVGKHVNAVFGKENDVTNDSLMVELTIKTDGRIRKHLGLGQKKLEQFAVDLVKNQEANDDFVIITRDNQRITPNELRIQKLVEVPAKAKSVDRDEAWKVLIEFYNDLCDTGAVEN